MSLDASTMLKQCQIQGLDPDTIQLHQQRIRSALIDGKENTLKIIDTCRIDNGGILQTPKVDAVAKNYIAFTPAAGASSRYFAILSDLRNALVSGESEQIQEHLQATRALGWQSWNLPPHISKLLSSASETDATMELDQATINAVLEELALPKALLPCVSEGDRFIDLKLAENEELAAIIGQVFVVRPDSLAAFITTPAKKPIEFLLQDTSLSTVRFDKDATPVIGGGATTMSVVPAGHGMLACLFPEVKKAFGEAHSLFIRNVDNVTGISAKVLTATNDFLNLHQFFIDEVNCIRQALTAKDYSKANHAAMRMLDATKSKSPGYCLDFLAQVPAEQRDLWRLQCELFHFDPESKAFFKQATSEELLSLLFSRPVNLLGQVPNTDRNIGGTPVFASDHGQRVKICLEAPHASQEDRDRFLADPVKATHFNPVFVAAEITQSRNHYHQSDSPFWIMAEKPFEGRKVYYHESVLYELLGNSLLANSAFVEVPREVFNPHKSIQGSGGHQRNHWLKT